MELFQNEKDYFLSLNKPREKPVVFCKLAYGKIVVGQRAHVVPQDHVAEYLNGQLAHTSTVQSVDADGKGFMTMNTHYVIVG